MAHLDSHLPFKLDSRDPLFPRKGLAWAAQTQLEISGTVASTNETIASSRELMARVDRILANGRG